MSAKLCFRSWWNALSEASWKKGDQFNEAEEIDDLLFGDLTEGVFLLATREQSHQFVDHQNSTYPTPNHYHEHAESMKPNASIIGALALATASLTFLAACNTPSPSTRVAEPPRPLRALLVIGGGWHDYEQQKDLLKAGLEARAHLQVDVAYTSAGPRATDVRMQAYASPDWAGGYDVIIHDECSEAVREMDYVQAILDVHKTIPAVNLHCTMHCYRWGNFRQAVEAGADNSHWYEFLGLQSTGHGPQAPIDVHYVDSDHPITQGLSDWTTINEELYNNVQIFDTAHVLSRGKQTARGRETETVVTWVNDYHGSRIFNTTLGHNNETVADPRYLDLVTRGLLWSCGKLNDTYLKPAQQGL